MSKPLIFLTGLIAFCCVFAPSAFGQVEFSGGYLFVRTGGVPGPGENLNGWDASIATHLIGGLGLEADYSDQYSGSSFVRPGFTELYGPRFEFLSFPRVEPYVHALVGTVHEVESSGCAPFQGCASSGQTSFGVAAGGGIEIKFTRHIWIRPFQLDYIHYKLGGQSQYSGRYSAGLVFRFGRW